MMDEEQSQQFIIDTVLNVTLLKSWYPPSMFSFNAATWFLSTILFAYLLVPQVVNFFQNRSNKFYIGALLAVIVVKMVLDTWAYQMPHQFWFPISFYTNPAYRFMDFLLGYVFFMAARNYRECSGKYGSALQVGVMGLYIVSCFVFVKSWLPYSYLLVIMLLIYVCTFKNCILDKVLGNKLFVYLGGISFELFILHLVVIEMCRHLYKLLGWEPFGITIWIITLIVSILMSIAVNKKVWKLMKRKTKGDV